jgi:hypothetical protein
MRTVQEEETKVTHVKHCKTLNFCFLLLLVFLFFIQVWSPCSVQEFWADHFLFLFFFCGTGVWTQGLMLARQVLLLLHLLYQSFFVMGFFETGSHKLFAWGWLQIQILLISASWIVRITGVSHWQLAPLSDAMKICQQWLLLSLIPCLVAICSCSDDHTMTFRIQGLQHVRQVFSH